MVNLMLFIWSIFLPILFGFALISLLNTGKILTLIQKLSLSFFLGNSIFTMLLFILSITNLGWDRVWISIIVCAISLGLLFIHSSKDKIILRYFALPKIRIVTLLLILLITFKLFSIFFLALDKPIINWDAWANWGLRAKVFYLEKGIPTNRDFPLFLGGGGHPNYPLQLPLMESWIYLVLDQWNDQLVKIISPLTMLFFIMFFYSFIRQFMSLNRSLIFSLIFLSIPFISYHASADYADLGVGLYIGIATMFLYLYILKNESKYLMFSSLMFGGAGWVKNEGVFLFVITALVFTVALVRKRGINNMKKIILPFISGLILLSPWLIFQRVFGLGISNLGADQGLKEINIHIEAVPQIVSGLATLSNFSLLWVALIIGIIFYHKRIRESRLGIFVILIFCYFFGFLFVYLFTQNIIYIQNGTILQRNLLTIAPSVFWITALILGNTLKTEE